MIHICMIIKNSCDRGPVIGLRTHIYDSDCDILAYNQTYI